MSTPNNNHAFMEVLESIPQVTPPPGVGAKSTPPVGVEAAAIVKRKKREYMLKKWSVVLRWLCFIFSFLAFVIMVSNRTPGWTNLNFEDYEGYSYVVAITVISSVYSIYQGIREVIQLVNGKCKFPQPAFAIIDFIGDQILAYLLISAASSAVPTTNDLRKTYSHAVVMKFVDMAAASISMAFFAFFTLALSLLISGHQLFAHFFT